MKLERSSGVLLHITSLPSPYGVGDLGPDAYKFVNFLKASGYSYWQLLPLNPTDEAYSHSPYSSDSAFAGNQLLISPELLEKEGYIKLKKARSSKEKSPDKVNFKAAVKLREELLEEAYQNFKSKVPAAFKSFTKKHQFWLDDYSLYKALREKYETSWPSWPEGLRERNPEEVKAAKEELAESIEKTKFIQFIFFAQWEKLTEYAHKQGVQFIGDIPFYINHDSADCWANSKYFKLDVEKQPLKISGVPPDYFSETGQLWGTPVYDWKQLKADKFEWWVERIRQNLLLFDLVRLDHFRAFAAYWEVPAEDETAINGKWVKTPGSNFFRIIKKEFPEMPFIAEDLGQLDEPVYKLLEEFNFPGMNVLQFAFGEEKRENPYLPFNHKPHSIVYTGTHDNNTTKAWFKNLDKTTKKHFRKYTGKNITKDNAHKALYNLALRSVAKLAVVPMQDILGLGKKGLMNIPGSTKGNWSWRLKPGQLPLDKTKKLKNKNKLYGRFVTKAEPKEKSSENE